MNRLLVKFLILSAAFLLCAGCGNGNAGKQGSGSPLSEEISKSIDVENVVMVNVINGSSGDIIKITDLDKIKSIMQFSGRLKAVRAENGQATGWLYAFEYEDINGAAIKVTFAGENSSVGEEKFNIIYNSDELKKFVEQISE